MNQVGNFRLDEVQNMQGDLGNTLEGVRVLDFTHLLAGPFCTGLLADAGADVVKVEPPWGDGARRRGSSRVTDEGHKVSSYFACVNRGKRSMAVDLSKAEGQQLLNEMLPSVDVLVENFLPGTIDRMGFPLGRLREMYPRLITVSISLFGKEHANSGVVRPGLAIASEGESGTADLSRDASGRPNWSGYPLGDFCAGLSAYGACMTALLRRALKDVGCSVDISMVRSLFAFNGVGAAGASINPDYAAPTTAPYGFFESADGYVAIGVNVDPLWQRLLGVMEREDLRDDPRYSDHVERDRRVEEVGEIVTSWTIQHPSSEIVRRVSMAGVPCGRVSTASEVLEDADEAAGLVVEIEDGLGGTVRVAANPFGIGTSGKALPRLGQHSAEVAAQWAGLDEGAIAHLLETGVIVADGLPRERSTPRLGDSEL